MRPFSVYADFSSCSLIFCRFPESSELPAGVPAEVIGDRRISRIERQSQYVFTSLTEILQGSFFRLQGYFEWGEGLNGDASKRTWLPSHPKFFGRPNVAKKCGRRSDFFLKTVSSDLENSEGG